MAATDHGSVVEILRGHTSPDTAYVVDDHPYSFGLVCRKRYWVETARAGSSRRGTVIGKLRLVTQTTNPRQSGEVWNKPKADNYYWHVYLVRYEDGEVGQRSFTMPMSPITWCRLYQRLWSLMTEDERDEIVAWVRLSADRRDIEWDRWTATVEAVRTTEHHDHDQWRAIYRDYIGEDGQSTVNYLSEHDYPDFCAYVEANGPDPRDIGWRAPRSTPVPLDD